MMDPPQLVVCRKVKGQRLLPGYRIGHRCEACNCKLQVSPEGVERLKSAPNKVVLLCNNCGLILARRLKERGMVQDVILHQAVREIKDDADLTPTGRAIFDLFLKR